MKSHPAAELQVVRQQAFSQLHLVRFSVTGDRTQGPVNFKTLPLFGALVEKRQLCANVLVCFFNGRFAN